MDSNKKNLWGSLKALLANADLKTYIYALGTIAVLVAILINVTSGSRYGKVKSDGKYYIDINKVANDYGLNLSPEGDVTSTDYVNSGDKNLTEDLSKSLYLTNMYLEQNGITDPTSRGKMLANVVLEYQKLATGKVYTAQDLNIIREETKDQIQEYYNDLSDAIKTYSASIKSINIPNSAGQNENLTESELINLKGILSSNILKLIDVNNSFINTLTSIPATKTASTYQLQLINLLSKQNSFLKSLAQIDNDPVKYLMLNGGAYNDQFKSDLSSINDAFMNYFIDNGIKF